MESIFKDLFDYFKDPNSIGKLSLSVALMSILLTIIFFTFGLYIEHERYQDQIDKLVKSITDEFNYLLPDELKKTLINLIKKDTKVKITNSDEKVDKENKKIKRNSIYFCILLLIIAIVINYYLYINNPNVYDFTYILKYTIILLLFLVITEIIFTLLIIRRFRLVNKDFVKIEIVDYILNKKWNCPF